MSIKILHQHKLQKSLKKERMYEMEKRYVSSFKVNEQTNEYNALQDKYAIHYFANRPVKKHLKRLVKAINLEPLTTQNQRMLSSLNQIIEIYNTQNVSERIIRHSSEPSKEIENPTTSAIKQTKASNLNAQNTKKVFVPHHIFDPYTQMMKPASIQKFKLLKLQTFKRKKINIGNKSNDSLQMRSGISETKQSTLIFKSKQKTQRSEQLQTNKRRAKNMSRVEINNQVKHLKLIDFINKKKNELESLHLHSKSPNQLSTPALKQDLG